MKTKDDKEIYDYVEAQESQAAAWFRELCEPGPDGSLSRSVAKPKLPMPMRLGELDQPAFLKRHQTPTAESIFMGARVARVALRSQYVGPGYRPGGMADTGGPSCRADKLNATRAQRRRQQKAAAVAADVARHAEAKAAEQKRARERERRRPPAELIDLEVEGGRYTRRQLNMAGSSHVPRVLGALFSHNSAPVQNHDTFGFPTTTAALQTAKPGQKRACAVGKQRDPERIAGSRRIPHHLRVMLHDQGLPASHSQAAAALTKGDRLTTSATGRNPLLAFTSFVWQGHRCSLVGARSGLSCFAASQATQRKFDRDRLRSHIPLCPRTWQRTRKHSGWQRSARSRTAHSRGLSL